MSNPIIFVSLTSALEGYFDSSYHELPDNLQKRIQNELKHLSWDNLNAEQRRTVTSQYDVENDPALEGERQYWWDFYQHKEQVERKIAEWKGLSCKTAEDMATKENRLKALNSELELIKSIESAAIKQKSVEISPVQSDYIPYPKAIRILRDKWQATPEELAAWLFDQDSGLAAYTNANELDPPPRFFYGYFAGNDSFDYVEPLMACWFLKDQVLNFSPQERYITGKDLIERWQRYSDIDPKAFICAKIRESRLIDGHPTQGLTQGTNPGLANSPPLESALFDLSLVEAIEISDFGEDKSNLGRKKIPGHLNFDPELQKQADQVAMQFFANKRRHPTKSEVAKLLSPQVGLSVETVTRRIRANWKFQSYKR